MRITSLGASNVLSFRQLDLPDLPKGLAVVVGPNGAGKSNLTRLVEMMTVALAWASGERKTEFARFADWRHEGAPAEESMTVRVGVALDRPSEQGLMIDFVRTWIGSQLLGGARFKPGDVPRPFLEQWLEKEVTARKIAALLSGELVASYRGLPGAEEWSIGYEVLIEGQRVAWSFSGPLQETVGVGSIAESEPVQAYGQLIERIAYQPGAGPQYQLRSFEIAFLLPDERNALVSGRPDGVSPQHAFRALAHLARDLEINIAQGSVVTLAQVIRHMFNEALVVVPGQRPVPRLYFSTTEAPTDYEPGDLGALPLRLDALDRGNRQQMQHFRRIEERFKELTGREFVIAAQQSRRQGWEHSEREIQVRIREGDVEVPLDIAGAGLWESLILAHATTLDDSTIVILDEPAQNLHPTLQRRVLTTLLGRDGQTLLITHSPYLVPTRTRADMTRTIRIERQNGVSQVRRLASAQLGDAAAREQEGQVWQFLGASTDMRGLIFARAVVLCEGETEVGVLQEWLNDLSGGEAPADRNVVFFDVGGDQRFGFYTRYLDGFGIPWAIACDPKVMNPSRAGAIYGQLGIKPSRPLPDDSPARQKAFARTRKRLEGHGVFTLVRDPDSEMESFLEQLDRSAWRKAKRSEGANKVRQGRVFATQVSRPASVTELWEKINKHLALA